MIHTEKGRLSELIAFMEQDRLFTAETLGVGPSGPRSRDKVLLADGRRADKFWDRLAAQNDIICALKALL